MLYLIKANKRTNFKNQDRCFLGAMQKMYLKKSCFCNLDHYRWKGSKAEFLPLPYLQLNFKIWQVQ